MSYNSQYISCTPRSLEIQAFMVLWLSIEQKKKINEILAIWFAHRRCVELDGVAPSTFQYVYRVSHYHKRTSKSAAVWMKPGGDCYVTRFLTTINTSNDLMFRMTCCSRLFVYADCLNSYVIYLYCTFIHAAHKDGVSSPENTELNDRVKNELKRMWKETVVAKSKVLSRNFLGGV